MNKFDFSNRENMPEIKWFLLQVLNFNEHGKTPTLQRGRIILTGESLSRIKPVGYKDLQHGMLCWRIGPPHI
jgi:hypothetical protein